MRGTIVALALGLCVSPLGAQTSSQPSSPLAEVQPGVRVRIAAPGIVAGQYVGTVLTRTADSISVGSPTGAPVVVPISRLSALEVSRGKSRMLGAKRGLPWGAAVGLIVGLATVSAVEECGAGCDGEQITEAGWVTVNTLSGALWGAGIGALIGREKWDSFALAPRPTVGVRHGGLMLSLHLSTR